MRDKSNKKKGTLDTVLLNIYTFYYKGMFFNGFEHIFIVI